MLVSTLPLWGYVMPLCYLFYPATSHRWLGSGLIRTLIPLFIGRALFYPKKKERYPSFIERSSRQYRQNRSKVLSALIGKNFHTLRGHRQLFREQIAQDMGIPAETLSQLEAGTLEITPSLLMAICDYFGVLIDSMVYQDLSIEQ